MKGKVNCVKEVIQNLKKTRIKNTVNTEIDEKLKKDSKNSFPAEEKCFFFIAQTSSGIRW
jgi:hypothetical protein